MIIAIKPTQKVVEIFFNFRATKPEYPFRCRIEGTRAHDCAERT